MAGDFACAYFQGWVATCIGCNLALVCKAAGVANLSKPCNGRSGSHTWNGLQVSEKLTAFNGASGSGPSVGSDEIAGGGDGDTRRVDSAVHVLVQCADDG